MAFASVYDLEQRWCDLTSAEEAQAAVLLEDATAYLMALVPVDMGNDEQLGLLKVVCCNMVKRAMTSAAGGVFGIEDATATMGPFSQRVEYANPTGDMYVTKAERAMLGIGGTKFGSIRANTDYRVVRHADR